MNSVQKQLDLIYVHLEMGEDDALCFLLAAGRNGHFEGDDSRAGARIRTGESEPTTRQGQWCFISLHSSCNHRDRCVTVVSCFLSFRTKLRCVEVVVARSPRLERTKQNKESRFEHKNQLE